MLFMNMPCCIRVSLGVLLAICSLATSGCQTLREDQRVDSGKNIPVPLSEKQRGAHVFAPPGISNFDFLTRNHIDWVTLVPWGNQEDFDGPWVSHHNGDSALIRKTDSSWIEMVNVFKSVGFKVFVKPHVWIHNPSEGKWRSDVFHGNDEAWESWQDSYRGFILRYAQLAEEGHADMFCIGTEFTRLSTEKPEFWRELIREVRQIFSGQLTYAANWYQEYEQIPFWQDLDFIGVQAYFPLSDQPEATAEQIRQGWSKYLPPLEAVSQKYGRKIIFTELGYKSTTDAAAKPWEWIDTPEGRRKSYSATAQVNCYQAFFDTVWHQKWFAGVHLWRFLSNYQEYESEKDHKGFSPLGKPAEQVISEGFGQE